MPNAGNRRKSHAAMVVPVTAKSDGQQVNWGGVGAVAGSTLQGLGAGLSSVSNGGMGGVVAPPVPDNTPILILGGVLLVGVIVFAMAKK